MKQIKHFVRFPRVTNTENKDFNQSLKISLHWKVFIGNLIPNIFLYIYTLYFVYIYITDSVSNVKIKILKTFQEKTFPDFIFININNCLPVNFTSAFAMLHLCLASSF